jgi:antitoxin (DNA-binding transcriptional repressor) of toxin-antitoxin stability system
MQEIPISKFKATGLAVLERVRKTGEPIAVTRFGHPIAQIAPPEAGKQTPRFGTGVGSITVHGDIVGPSSDISDGEAARNRDENEMPTGHPHMAVEFS